MNFIIAWKLNVIKNESNWKKRENWKSKRTKWVQSKRAKLKKEEQEEPAKTGDEIGGDLLNLEAENESSIETKDKEDKKEDENAEHESKEEEKGGLFKSNEDENEEGEYKGERADDEEQNFLDE